MALAIVALLHIPRSDGGLTIRRLISMNDTLLKKLLAVALTSLFLVSMGASAGGAKTEQECTAAGGTWDSTTMKCTMPEGK